MELVHYGIGFIPGFRSAAFWDQFQSPTEEDAARQKTKELDDCNTLSISPSSSSSSFNLFVRQAAAQFWSTVVCLCQMPKRLWNEEGQMKRGWVAAAVVCDHARARTRPRTHRHCRILQTVLASDPSPSPLPLVSFTRRCLFRNTGKVECSNMVTQMKFNWNCTELEERKGEQQTNYHPCGLR